MAKQGARPLRRWELPAHRLATRLMRAALWRPRARRTGAPRVQILLMHAWGMGGTIRTTLHLAGHLARTHDVEIISIVRRRDKPFFAFPPGVKVTAVDDQRPGPRRRGLRTTSKRLLRARRSFLIHPADRAYAAGSLVTDVQIVRALARLRPGVLIGTRPALNLLAIEAAGRGLAAIGQEHMHFAAHHPVMQEEIRRRYGRLDAVTVLTESDLRDYQTVLPGSTRVTHLPNAVPMPPGPPAPLDRPVILAAGRLTGQKGFDRLIRAFARIAPDHPDWIVRIAGRGPARRSLRALIREHGLQGRVRLPGAVRNLGRAMDRSSLFVLSSRFEGLPMVLLEAMSHGRPVISFDCPTGPGEIIEHGVDGLLVEDGDEEALAETMRRVMTDLDLRRRLAEGARAKAQAAYSLDAIGRRWEALLSAIAAR